MPARGQARSDLDIIFGLATRLGLGEHFWNGDIDAAFRYRSPRSAVASGIHFDPAFDRARLVEALNRPPRATAIRASTREAMMHPVRA